MKRARQRREQRKIKKNKIFRKGKTYRLDKRKVHYCAMDVSDLNINHDYIKLKTYASTRKKGREVSMDKGEFQKR